MNKQIPTLGKLLAMISFMLVAVSLLLYLWLSFGGSVPFQPKGYRVQLSFEDAGQLAEESDVRISGVNVGSVKKVKLSGNGRSEVTVEIDDKYAPRPVDTRAVLRQKTLLGESYIELTPGSSKEKTLADGDKLPTSQVQSAVELDEIFRSLDPQTRESFQVWLQSAAQSIDGRGLDLSTALGVLPSFIESGDDLLTTINSQDQDLQKLVSNGAEVFSALSERDGQLSSMIRNLNDVFATTADRNVQLKEAVQALPTFENEADKTVKRLTRFAQKTDPLITRLQPVASELTPTLQQLQTSSPQLSLLIDNLDELAISSRRGLPALDRSLNDLRPLLGQLDPALRNVNPMLDFLSNYKREITAFFANGTAASQATSIPGESGSELVHHLRVMNKLNLELLSAYPQRVKTNRSNPYHQAGSFDQLAEGLKVYEDRNCLLTGIPTLTDGSSGSIVDATMRSLIEKFIYTADGPGAPRCERQDNFNLNGRSTQYPQITEQPER